MTLSTSNIVELELLDSKSQNYGIYAPRRGPGGPSLTTDQ